MAPTEISPIDLVQFARMARDLFPGEELSTERLRLRAYTEADADDHFLMMDHDLIRQWTNAPVPYTREHAVEWCRREANDARTDGTGINWAVVDRDSGKFLGAAGLNHTNWEARVTDVFALGSPWAVGHGYAQEALREICRWVLVEQRFHRLQITAAVGNRRSRRVAEACGFVREGVLRNAGYTHGGQVDLVMYGLVRDDLENAERS